MRRVSFTVAICTAERGGGAPTVAKRIELIYGSDSKNLFNIVYTEFHLVRVQFNKHNSSSSFRT